MFGMNPQAWLEEHHRENRLLVRAALDAGTSRAAPPARAARTLAPATAPLPVFGPPCEPVCC